MSSIRTKKHSNHRMNTKYHLLWILIASGFRYFRLIALFIIFTLCTFEQSRLTFKKCGLACTATYIEKSRIMLKSYDWHDGAGVLYFNPKGIRRHAFPHESLQGKQSIRSSAHSWNTLFASVSFNQYGRGFPNGGINERGLAIEVLWLNETEYVERDRRPYLNELEWVQYVLDTCESVKQIEALVTKVRISPIHGQIHYFFCDQSGDCGALEFIKGSMKFYRNELHIPSLTNHSYEQSTTHANKQQSLRESREERLSQVYKSKRRKNAKRENRGSLARFLSAQELSKSEDINTLQLGLDALEQVKIRGYTKWQIAYDLKHLKIAFRTNKNQI